MIKLPQAEKSFDSLFYFHVQTDFSKLSDTIRNIFNDDSIGKVVRLKGFIQNEKNEWTEVNATRTGISINPVSTGQELFIVIGEHLNKERIGDYWDSYRNGV